jgi:hypothetical protein
VVMDRSTRFQEARVIPKPKAGERLHPLLVSMAMLPG